MAIKRDADGNKVYKCPVCHSGTVKVRDSVFYGRCELCNATLIDYVPLQHQEAFHNDNAQYRLNIGGFGSGKTTASCAEVAIHCYSISDARFLITAPTLKQVTEAVLPELEKFLAPWMIEYKRKAPTPYYKLVNGSEIIVYSSDDQQNLRSLNLTGFYIEEASGVKYEIFDQLMTRLRNQAGIVRDEEGREIGYHYLGIICTNPEDAWIVDKFMLKSSKIVASPSIDINKYRKLMDKDVQKHFHTFISSTRDNKHLPKEFIERVSAGKSARWVRKYIDCSLEIKEGAVYADYVDYVVEPFEIPAHWKRISGFDPGFRDPCANVIGAIDPRDGCIYCYDEYYVVEKPVSYHAKQLAPKFAKINLLLPIQADPSVKKRNERDGRSYADYFYSISGLYLEPGDNDILFGIAKVQDYMYAGKLKFFNTLENLKFEAGKYSYPKEGARNSNEKPIDKHNHLWDCVRYMIAKLPQNPYDMNTFAIQQNELNSRPVATQEDVAYDYDDYGNVYGGFKL